MDQLAGDKGTILLVDDDPDVLAALEGVLTSANYECHRAADAQTALATARYVLPELIICDINLDGENGLELCEEIKRQKELADICIMFLSGAQIPDIIRRSHAAGAAYYLRKPFDPVVLLELIDKALERARLIGSQADR